ncbi:MAG: hypothetical protein IJ877_06960 [Candidatus Gastranaerophilales bacterium]|nr:hypothetical protein [Candidatus Gastranaerophilales bacterium]
MIEKIINSNIYNNKTLLKSLKFVSENSPVFTAGASLAFASVVRPVSTLLAPKTDKEDKKLSCVKSISSAITGFLFMSLVSAPFSKAVKNIDNNPKEFLTKETINNLSNGLDNVTGSKSYQFITQLFKLGLGFLLAYPKALTNNALIPAVMNKLSNKKDEKPSFKGKLENVIAGTINNEKVQNFANKMKDTNYTTHLIALGDVFSTLAFSVMTSKNKKLDKHQKQVLNYNAAISTALCLLGGYGIDKALDKPMTKFIENLKNANKNSPDLAKYTEGSKIVKTSLIFGVVYYCLIPLISTFLSSKIASKTNETSPLNKNNL